MALNIKNLNVDRAARELADLTGETLTEAISKALHERLERQRARSRPRRLRDELMAIGQRCASLPRLDERPTEEILGYDEHGLPR